MLHQRGYHSARILPGMSASGGYWRVAITAAADFQTDDGYLRSPVLHTPLWVVAIAY